MTKFEFGSIRLEAFLKEVMDEYGKDIYNACADTMEKIKDSEDFQPTLILKQAKKDCGHHGERLLLRHRAQHFVT